MMLIDEMRRDVTRQEATMRQDMMARQDETLGQCDAVQNDVAAQGDMTKRCSKMTQPTK